MNRIVVSLIALVVLTKCRASTPVSAPIQSRVAAATRTTQVAPVKERKVINSMEDLQSRIEGIQLDNEKLGRPTIGLVRAFYSLPVANPIGAARFEQGSILGFPYQRNIVQQSVRRPYAIKGADVFATSIMQDTINALLESGIRLNEISMADANQIMAAERAAIEGGEPIQWNAMVPSGVDYIISVQQGRGIQGPVYLARMVRTLDGALMAVKTSIDVGAPFTLRTLLVDVIEQGFKVSANHLQIEERNTPSEKNEIFVLPTSSE